MSRTPKRCGPKNPDTVISLGAVASRFGRSRDWLYRHLNELIEQKGFPKPARDVGEKGWDPSSVEAWFKRYHPDRQEADAMKASDGEAGEAEGEADDIRDQLRVVYVGAA